MNLLALAHALRAAAAALEAEEQTAAPGDLYDAQRLPPGAASWRSVLDAGRRGELDVSHVGRRAVVTADAWRTFVDAKKTSRRTRVPMPVAQSDADVLAEMGVVVPLRKVGAP